MGAASVSNLELVVEVFNMDVNGSDATFELDLQGIRLALLGGGSDEEARVKDSGIVSTENAHLSDGNSKIESCHPSLITHGSWRPVVEQLRSGGVKEEGEEKTENQQVFGGHLYNII